MNVQLDSLIANAELMFSITNDNKYPFNLNDNLYNNVIETKKEIELEYIKNYILVDTKNKTGKGTHYSIFIF